MCAYFSATLLHAIRVNKTKYDDDDYKYDDDDNNNNKWWHKKKKMSKKRQVQESERENDRVTSTCTLTVQVRRNTDVHLIYYCNSTNGFLIAIVIATTPPPFVNENGTNKQPRNK